MTSKDKIEIIKEVVEVDFKTRGFIRTKIFKMIKEIFIKPIYVNISTVVEMTSFKEAALIREEVFIRVIEMKTETFIIEKEMSKAVTHGQQIKK